MFPRKLVVCFSLLAMGAPLELLAQRRHTEDRDLLPIDLSKWDCIDQPGGTAKTQNGVERNKGKNRSMVDLSQLRIPAFDTATLLKAVSSFDSQTKGKRREDLSSAQKVQLAAIEKEVISFTGYLVLAYPGPPETTNCGDADFHDWHLEVFENPMNHPPGIGDPTPIICEITPRLQNMFYEQGIKLQDIAGYLRLPDLSHQDNKHPARQVRFTGYVLWDDDHNGSADIGPRVSEKGKNGYHHPWRSTAFEIHPVLKIEVLDGPQPVPVAAQSAAAIPAPPADAAPPAGAPPAPAATVAAAPPVAAPSTPAGPQIATILQPVKVKIPYGETVLPRGTRVEVISRKGAVITVRYLGQDVLVPQASTDLR